MNSSHATMCPLYYIIRQNNDTAWHTLCACVTKKQYTFSRTIGVAIVWILNIPHNKVSVVGTVWLLRWEEMNKNPWEINKKPI